MELATAVSCAHIAVRARELLESSEALLNDSRGIQISKDDIDSINHDTHLAFALLGRRYNSQVPVNRLHPELLGMVFEHIRAPTRVMNLDDSLEQPVFDTYEPLLKAMMVCRKWYIVASEKALLWTDITLDCSRGRAGPTCLLKRSGTAPIHLRLFVEGSAEDKAYLCEVVHMNASRLRQLDVCVTDVDTMHTVGQLLEDDMPLLQCLKVSDEYYQRNVVLRTTSGRLPSLRGMMLTRHLWLPAPEIGPFMKLTHLYVSMLSDEIPMSSITALLDAAPALEVLELHECSEVTVTQLPTHTTTLEHLTHLTIRRMSTRAAEVLMPALFLPRAAVVSLLFDVDTPPTDALLPQPEHWRDATRVRIDDGTYGSLSVELDGGAHRVGLCLEYDADVLWEGQQDLWPLPVPASPFELGNISAVHLSTIGNWIETLRQFVARVPALATLVIEEHRGDEAIAREMVDAMRDVLLHGESLCTGLKEVALLLPSAVDGLTERLAPALKKRKNDGQQVRRLRIWIDNRPGGEAGDTGDALAEYIEAGEVEHEGGPFWQRDEEQWRRENEFWEVPKTWL